MLKRILILVFLMSSFEASAKETSCDGFLNFNNNVDKTKKDFLKSKESMSWNWFVDLTKKVKNKDYSCWETFKPTSEVYLSNGTRPTDYEIREETPKEVIKQAKAKNMDMSKIFHNIDSYLQVDGLPLEMGGHVPNTEKATFVRYQLLMSEGTFNYILDKKVYNVNGQENLTEDLDFPKNAWELKTSWLWIGDDKSFLKKLKKDNYIIANGYYKNEDGVYKVGYIALSGMHIINKLFDDWTWMTFENKNNYKYTITNGFPAKPMTNETGPNSKTAAINSEFQKKYPLLKSYELIGVQSDFNDNPKLLANSQMESAFQSHSSCISCHYTAAYSNNKGYYNFAQRENEGILYPIIKTPDSMFKDYKKLDFVWSLKRAQWEK